MAVRVVARWVRSRATEPGSKHGEITYSLQPNTTNQLHDLHPMLCQMTLVNLRFKSHEHFL